MSDGYRPILRVVLLIAAILVTELAILIAAFFIWGWYVGIGNWNWS